MKYKYLILLFLFSAVQASARVRTVSNYPASIAQYNTIQAAVNASASGDTIYIHGSPNIYEGCTITDKKLTLIGPGFNPSKEIPFGATVTGIIGDGAASAIIINGNSNGCEIQGLSFRAVVNGVIVFNGSKSDIRIIRNRFDEALVFNSIGSTVFSNFYFEGNFFNNGGSAGFRAQTTSQQNNWLFQNNVFRYDRGDDNTGQFQGFFSNAQILFNHNLFYGRPGEPANRLFNNNQEAAAGITYSNNIFIRKNLAVTPGPAAFSNNITFECGNNEPWLANGSSNGGGNLANVNPQMVSQDAVNASSFVWGDFSILGGPAKNAGSDGRDIGLMFDLTGRYNWAKSGTSLLPTVIRMSLPNPAIPVGGSLEVKLSAVKAN